MTHGRYPNPQNLFESYPEYEGTGSAWKEILMSMLCPGLVWAQKGYTDRAIASNLGFSLAWVVYVFIWVLLKFHPVTPTIVFFIGWLGLLGVNAVDAHRALNRRSIPPSQSFVAGLSFFTWFGVLLLIAGVTFSRVGSVVTVSSASMFPTILPGDLIFVDRNAYTLVYPDLGDVVLYQVHGRTDVRIGRIVGLGGDVVQFSENNFSVSAAEVAHAAIEGAYAEDFEAITGMSPNMVGARYELLDHHIYPVAGMENETNAARFAGQVWEVIYDHVFVLNDNREAVDDSRTIGSIHVSQIIGMPLYILDSRVRNQDLRRLRRGARVQYPIRLMDGLWGPFSDSPEYDD